VRSTKAQEIRWKIGRKMLKRRNSKRKIRARIADYRYNQNAIANKGRTEIHKILHLVCKS
jgi:hypothetical protein